MPRILVTGFCAFPGPDRAGAQLRHIVRGLVRDYQVDVLCTRRGDQAYVERWSGARLLRVPTPDGPLRDQIEAFRRALRRQLEGADYHVLHVRDGIAGQVALELAGRLRLAVVFDAARGPISEPGSLDVETAQLAAPAEAQLVRMADLVLAGSDGGCRVLAEAGGGERVHLVPPGVDVDAFDVERVPPGRQRILYVGQLSPRRGVRILVRAMLELVGKHDAELVLAGPPAAGFVAGLEAAIRELDLAGRVVVRGEVPYDALPVLIASATICVAPSAAELGPRSPALFPTKLLEYMACQRAVVAPRSAAVSALIQDGESGLLFEPGQPLDLADKLGRLLGDAELRARLAVAGYDLVRRSYTASATRRELRKAYAWLAARPALRDRLAEASEDQPTGSHPSGSAADSDGGGFVRAPARTPAARAISAFDDPGLDDDADAAVDTGMNEGFGEVTKVEPPGLGFDDRAGTYPAGATAVDAAALADDWVVEDSRIREVGLGDRPGRSGERSSGAMESRFVAGELEVPARPAARVPDAEPAFVAMSPPLGFGPVDAPVAEGETVEFVRRTPSPGPLKPVQ